MRNCSVIALLKILLDMVIRTPMLQQVASVLLELS
jgi:hypothetical protein